MGLTYPKTVGVLGGLGPAATLDFYAKVLALTPARSDQEHLHLIIDSNPKVPNRNEAIAGRGPSPAPMLAEMALRLERAGADFLVMACNAAHAFQPDIEAVTRIPFVSIIEETVQATLETAPGLARVGVLASSGCLEAKLYQNAFDRHGVEVGVLGGTERETFMRLLYRIKAGERGADVSQAMCALAEHLVHEGAEAIVAGCTEVPLVLTPEHLPCPFVDSSAVLAVRTVFYATHGLPERLAGD